VTHSTVDDHALLCEAVRAAGAIALDYFERGFEVREKNPGDPVTEADLAVDEALKARLMAARPDYGWLSEETEDDGSRLTAPRTWIVDPIDGTKGFVEGNHQWVVSAALVEAGRPVCAVVFNPGTEQFIDARKGGGTRLDGKTVRATRAVSLADATLGSSHNEQRRQLWQHLFPDSAIAVVDAIAYKIALVAIGEHDAVIALRPKSDWDIAAGDLLVTEAGGVMSDADGNPLLYNLEGVRKPHLVASGAVLYPALRAALDRR
jgi:myo-inositol-1(or 4)-monophosphatase